MSKFRRQLMMANVGEAPTPPTPVLPYDAQVEYLQSDGIAYIDTGYFINYNSTDVVEEKCRLAYTVTNVRQLNGSNGLGYWGITSGGKWECAKGASTTSAGTSWHNISFNYYKGSNGKGHVSLIVDNTSVKSGDETISNSDNYAIFIYAIGGRNNAAAQLFSKEKISEYQLVINSVTVRDYIAVRKDGVGYLYDKVSETLFGNANSTGAFIYGNDVTT